MKNKLVLFLLTIVITTNLYSQDCFLYVSTQNERLKPSTKSVGFPQNEILAQIFKEFEVTSYYQSFLGTKTPELQHFYEIHFKGDADKLEKALIERKVFDKIYRCDHYGIKIINVSWTGIASHPNLLAVQEMTNNGVVLVTAAGNVTTRDSLSHKNYADIPGMINVSGVDVCALSKEVIICFPYAGSYGTSGGTSLAAPQVAGVVALMRSINNDITPAEIENIIKSTADPIADANQYPELIGTGRVNAYKALLATLNLCHSITLTGQNPELPETCQRTVCKEINVQNATVPAGTTLILDATNKTTINPGFKVEAGASFTIR